MPKLNQEQLLAIFNMLKAEMLPYEKGSIQARFNIEGKYDLWSEIPGLTIEGRLRNEVAFCAIIIQSTYVGFYYMPIYGAPDNVGSQLAASFLKMLKGKACFHIKDTEPETIAEVRKALQIGYNCYKNLGWVID